MKKLLYSLFFVGLAASSQAQSFSAMDTAVGTYTGNGFELHNNMVSTSANTIRIKWNVVVASSNFPSAWTSSGAPAGNSMGICDNFGCRTNTSNQLTSGTAYKTGDIAPRSTSDFHLQLDMDGFNVPNGTYYLTVKMFDSATNYTKNTVFKVTKSATSVPGLSKSQEDVELFPNPAHNTLNVRTDANIRSAIIFNLIGKNVGDYRLNGGEGSIDVSDLPSGVYYLRLMDAQGRLFTTRRFTRQ